MEICKENVLRGTQVTTERKTTKSNQRAEIWSCWSLSTAYNKGHPYVPAGLIGRLWDGGKMSDLVVAVLQLTRSSSRNSPAKPLGVGPGAPGGGVLSQAFSNQLPHDHQVSISDLHIKQNKQVHYLLP